MFALHACLAHTAALYARGEAAIVHAVASPYRGRLHFDGQDILESGAARPYARHDGCIRWLLPLLRGGRAVEAAPTILLVLHGSHAAVHYTPSRHVVHFEHTAYRRALLFYYVASPTATWASN